MYKLKKMEGYYEYICWDRALVLWKKNLPGRGLTKVEKHCSTLSWPHASTSESYALKSVSTNKEKE